MQCYVLLSDNLICCSPDMMSIQSWWGSWHQLRKEICLTLPGSPLFNSPPSPLSLSLSAVYSYYQHTYLFIFLSTETICLSHYLEPTVNRHWNDKYTVVFMILSSSLQSSQYDYLYMTHFLCLAFYTYT